MEMGRASFQLSRSRFRLWITLSEFQSRSLDIHTTFPALSQTLGPQLNTLNKILNGASDPRFL
ncbi:hypothetical protein HanXRQr2_Chr12g0553351 [Helianthus annuus]|uniref:Uncharacterized protein n=1 Tax=Helianthus annuus TaxID=4232 RepID=A0A9K3MXH9_HELAN|nr:hypothetical protein HanXRQr2_Chr12g0553351 [Helianthus annuus]KAJ0863664.1 hypothetical protein HanPSC8_Chr12g0532681 [Helianthus annuus]